MIKNNIRWQSFLFTALSLTVAMSLLGYSAYGWMSMSSTVRATGESMTVTAPSNLQISRTGNDDDWHESVSIPLLDYVKNNDGYNQGHDGFYLLPSSSYGGYNDTFWQTSKISGVIHDNAELLTTPFNAGKTVTWNESTGANEGHYIDVPLYFRTLGSHGISIGLTTPNGGVSTIRTLSGANVAETVRVAFLDATDRTKPSIGTEPLVYALPTAGTSRVIAKTGDEFTLREPSYIRDDLSKTLFTLDASEFSGETMIVYPKQIVVRIWVEGQDDYCVATIGGKAFEINLAFTMIEE